MRGVRASVDSRRIDLPMSHALSRTAGQRGGTANTEAQQEGRSRGGETAQVRVYAAELVIPPLAGRAPRVCLADSGGDLR